MRPREAEWFCPRPKKSGALCDHPLEHSPCLRHFDGPYGRRARGLGRPLPDLLAADLRLHLSLPRLRVSPDAQDLTQDFFLHILEGHLLERADPERGKFRTLLLKALTNFLSDMKEKRSARKRGGEVQFVSWDDWMAGGAIAFVDSGERAGEAGQQREFTTCAGRPRWWNARSAGWPRNASARGAVVFSIT